MYSQRNNDRQGSVVVDLDVVPSVILVATNIPTVEQNIPLLHMFSLIIKFENTDSMNTSMLY